jgi:membrane-associated phospholipid phosphatase
MTALGPPYDCPMASGPRRALLFTLACISALIVECVLVVGWDAGRAANERSLAGFEALENDPHVARAAGWIASAATPVTYALLGALLTAVALVRRRYRLAFALPVALVGASVTAELLKRLLSATDVPSGFTSADYSTPWASWPSGHATAAMMVALCAVLVAPRALSPVIASVGGGIAIGVGYAMVVLAQHSPGDILGGFLVAGAWVSMLVAGLTWSERRRPSHSGFHEKALGRRPVIVGLAFSTAGVVVLSVLAGGAPISVGAGFIAAATAIPVTAALLTCGLVAALHPHQPLAGLRRRSSPAAIR